MEGRTEGLEGPVQWQSGTHNGTINKYYGVRTYIYKRRKETEEIERLKAKESGKGRRKAEYQNRKAARAAL